MTSLEIKNKIESIIKTNPDGYYPVLYGFFCEDMKQAANEGMFKNNYYKWLNACDEISKSLPNAGIDKTYPTAIFAAHARINKGDKDNIKRKFGWDIEKILKGKVCYAADIIIRALELGL